MSVFLFLVIRKVMMQCFRIFELLQDKSEWNNFSSVKFLEQGQFYQVITAQVKYVSQRKNYSHTVEIYFFNYCESSVKDVDIWCK